MKVYLGRKNPLLSYIDVNGLQQAKIARKTGVAQSYVSRILSGSQPVQLWFLLKMSAVTGLSMDTICKDLETVK
jgi:transcriptional regulator with XRE-family HTH domain